MDWNGILRKDEFGLVHLLWKEVDRRKKHLEGSYEEKWRTVVLEERTDVEKRLKEKELVIEHALEERRNKKWKNLERRGNRRPRLQTRALDNLRLTLREVVNSNNEERRKRPCGK